MKKRVCVKRFRCGIFTSLSEGCAINVKKTDKREAEIGSRTCHITATWVSMALGNNILKQLITRSELIKSSKKTLLTIIYSSSV